MDYVVIGAGPAGLQLGYFLQRAGREYLIVEAGPTPGTFYRTFPRHRRMISINKPHTGWHDAEKDLRVDWNSLLSDDPALRFTRCGCTTSSASCSIATPSSSATGGTSSHTRAA